jgi:rubrerythrin
MLEEATPRKALEFAVTTEKIGAQIYQKLAKRFEDNEELKELFTSLAKDEQAHEREFKALLDRLPVDDNPVQYEQEQYLRAMAISDVFSDEEGIGKSVDAISTREDALERALSLEKSTLMYYTALSDVIGTSEAVDAIIAAEKRHVIRVMQLMITGERPKPL